MTRSTLALMLVLGWLLVALPIAVHFELRHAAQRIDCGPDGVSVLNGTACIDRHPVTIP